MRYALAVLAVLLAQDDVAKVDELQPQKEGFTWTYVSGSNEGRVKIAGRQKIGDVDCFIVETDRPGGAIREYLSVGAEGLRLHRMDAGKTTENYQPPLVRFKSGTKKGDRWEWKGKVGAQDVEASFTNEGREEVKVPAGTFNAWRIGVTMKVGATVIASSNFYAPGVGLVRQDNTVTAGGRQQTASLSLKSYEAPK